MFLEFSKYQQHDRICNQANAEMKKIPQDFEGDDIVPFGWLSQNCQVEITTTTH